MIGDPKKSDIYFASGYDDKKRFASYWHQINEVISLNPGNVLEIGVGNGFFGDYLRKRSFSVTGVDNDPGLSPDIVGDVRDLPFEDGQFDVSVCFEVLEHIPYEHFKEGLSELRRVTASRVMISLPDPTLVWRFLLELPLVGRRKLMITWPGFRMKEYGIKGPEHCWEIGVDGCSLKRIRKDIGDTGFRVERTYRVFENPYHRFFVLEKI